MTIIYMTMILVKWTSEVCDMNALYISIECIRQHFATVNGEFYVRRLIRFLRFKFPAQLMNPVRPSNHSRTYMCTSWRGILEHLLPALAVGGA